MLKALIIKVSKRIAKSLGNKGVQLIHICLVTIKAGGSSLFGGWFTWGRKSQVT